MKNQLVVRHNLYQGNAGKEFYCFDFWLHMACYSDVNILKLKKNFLLHGHKLL